jgi:hypothetical protein
MAKRVISVPGKRFEKLKTLNLTKEAKDLISQNGMEAFHQKYGEFFVRAEKHTVQVRVAYEFEITEDYKRAFASEDVTKFEKLVMDEDSNYTDTKFKISSGRKLLNMYKSYTGVNENPFGVVLTTDNIADVHDILDSIEKYTIEEDDEGRKINYPVEATSFIVTPYSEVRDYV